MGSDDQIENVWYYGQVTVYTNIEYVQMYQPKKVAFGEIEYYVSVKNLVLNEQ